MYCRVETDGEKLGDWAQGTRAGPGLSPGGRRIQVVATLATERGVLAAMRAGSIFGKSHVPRRFQFVSYSGFRHACSELRNPRVCVAQVGGAPALHRARGLHLCMPCARAAVRPHEAALTSAAVAGWMAHYLLAGETWGALDRLQECTVGAFSLDLHLCNKRSIFFLLSDRSEPQR